MLEGFVKFPQTRNYRFNQYSDDSGFFAIAKDPVNDGAFVVPGYNDMRVVVEERGCCRRRWGNYIYGIKKDEIYYVRAWYKEGGGGDYGYFGWDYSKKSTRETIPLDYFVNAREEQVKAVPTAMGRLNSLYKEVDEMSTQVKDLPALKKAFDSQKKSFDEQLPQIKDDRQTLERKADEAVVSAEVKSLGKQMDQLEVKLSKSESRLEDKVQVSTTKADNAVSSVRSDLDKFKQVDFNKVKQDTRDDLKTVRDDIELDVGEKVQDLQEKVSSQEKMLGDFKSNLIGAINDAASARLDALVVDIAPPVATAPRIFTSDNGRLNFETTHERVTVNEVEIPNVDDVVSTVNAGVATGFNYLADAMKGL
jgi:flagellar biosynthesis chaperone FliJ